MRREDGGSGGLPGWVVMLVVVLGGAALIYALVCAFLAAYLWFNPIVF